MLYRKCINRKRIFLPEFGIVSDNVISFRDTLNPKCRSRTEHTLPYNIILISIMDDSYTIQSNNKQP